MTTSTKQTCLLIAVAAIALTAIGSLTSCTENLRAKQYGGTATVSLTPNQKLVNATWKDQELWYLTRQMRANETPETFTLTEQSSFGLIEGKVVFSESK
jgi:hypothetical protein